MDPEKNRQRLPNRLLFPLFLGLALLLITRAFQRYMVWPWPLVLYAVITVFFIVLTIRSIRYNKSNRDQF